MENLRIHECNRFVEAQEQNKLACQGVYKANEHKNYMDTGEIKILRFLRQVFLNLWLVMSDDVVFL